MTGENAASIYFQAITQEGTYCNHLTGVPFHPKFEDFKKMPVLLLADGRCSQIVVWGIDRVSENCEECADEEVFCNEFPLYFSQEGHRKSPSYYLLNIADAIRQFFEHAKVPRPEVMTVLQTNTFLWNYDDMKAEWEHFKMHVIMQKKMEKCTGWPAVIPEGSKMEMVFASLCHFMQTPGKCKWLFDRAVEGLLAEEEIIGNEATMRKRKRLLKNKKPTKKQLQEEKEARRYTEQTIFDDDEFMKWCCGEDDDEAEDVMSEKEDDEMKSEEEEDAKCKTDDKVMNEDSESEDQNGDIFGDELFQAFDYAKSTPNALLCEEDELDRESKVEAEVEVNADDAIYDVDVYVPDDLRVEVLNPYRNPERMAQKLIGMTELREFIQRLTALSQFQVRLNSVHPNAHFITVNLHSIFQGPVGTGKTTAARLMGSFFRQAHVLTRGHVVVCGMQSFTGENFGSEENNVHQLLKLARGGVLFIDEAYQLAPKHPHDPLRKVLPMMLNLLADESNRDIAVILAGYEAEMDNLLSMNPGLRSRFPNRFVFKGFSYDELLKIAQRRVQSDGFSFTRDAWRKLSEIIRQAYETKDKEWGNGRYISNLLEYIYMNHAQRCVNHHVSDAQLLRITAADVTAPPSTKTATSRAIGFCA